MRLSDPMGKNEHSSGQRGPAATGIPPVCLCMWSYFLLPPPNRLMDWNRTHNLLCTRCTTCRCTGHECVHAHVADARTYTGSTGSAVAVHRSSSI